MSKNTYDITVIYGSHLERSFIYSILWVVTLSMCLTLVLHSWKWYFLVYYKNSKLKNNTVSGGRSRSRSQTGGAPAANPENNGDDKGKKESWKDWIERNFVYILLGAFTSFLVFCLIAGYLGYGPGETGEISEEVYRRYVTARSAKALQILTPVVKVDNENGVSFPPDFVKNWNFCNGKAARIGGGSIPLDPVSVNKNWHVFGDEEFQKSLKMVENYYKSQGTYTPDPEIFKFKTAKQ